MTPLTIRAARPADWTAVRALLEAAQLPHADLGADAMEEFLVAERGSALDGAIGLERAGRVGLLRSLVVAGPARGSGTGGRLVRALEEKAWSRGVRELWLLTIDAGEFFSRRGYLPQCREAPPPAIRDSREFSALCPANAALFRKRLQSD